MTRLETLLDWVNKDPNDVFSVYGLAMEYVKTGNLDGALKTFDDLVRRFPDYVPTYYHMGKALESGGRYDDAREIYRQGMAKAGKAGDTHAVAELEEALESMDG